MNLWKWELLMFNANTNWTARADSQEEMSIIRKLYFCFDCNCPHWMKRLEQATAPPANRSREMQ